MDVLRNGPGNSSEFLADATVDGNGRDGAIPMAMTTIARSMTTKPAAQSRHQRAQSSSKWNTQTALIKRTAIATKAPGVARRSGEQGATDRGVTILTHATGMHRERARLRRITCRQHPDWLLPGVLRRRYGPPQHCRGINVTRAGQGISSRRSLLGSSILLPG